MANKLLHIADRCFGTPLMVSQEKLDAIISAIGGRVGVIPVIAEHHFENEKAEDGELSETIDAIRVIKIHGTLVKRGGFVDALSGIAGYDSISREFEDAVTDSSVKAVLFDIDSNGGEVGGCFDLVDTIVSAKGIKPVWAMTDNAFSAAYAIASAADRIIVPQNGGVGSVGVIIAHIDETEKDKTEGRKYTILHAGERKADFSPHLALTDKMKGIVEERLDTVYQQFMDIVSKNRSLPKEAVRATQAGTYFGQKALEIGFCDEVGTMKTTMDKLINLVNTSQRGLKMAHTEETEQKEQKAMGGDVPQKAQYSVLDAEEVAQLCELVGKPELTSSYINAQKKPAEVRAEFLKLRAEKDAAFGVSSHTLPHSGASATDGGGDELLRLCEQMAKEGVK